MTPFDSHSVLRLAQGKLDRARIVLALSLLASLVAAANVSSQTPKPPADDPRFTGISTVMDAKDLGAARRRFEAGARSAWHSHDRGQLLWVEEGRLRIGKKGQGMKEFGQGESDYTAPNVVHWHGATPDRPAIQVYLNFVGETKWMEKVTDEEYAGKK
jgi:quercetin dioxygenase-like cupin family protein